MIPLAPKLNLGRVWCDAARFWIFPWRFRLQVSELSLRGDGYFSRNSEGEMVFMACCGFQADR